MPNKTKKVWTFLRKEDRSLEAYLNGLSEKGHTVFSVYPSASIGGAYEVLSYHAEKLAAPQAGIGTGLAPGKDIAPNSPTG